MWEFCPRYLVLCIYKLFYCKNKQNEKAQCLHYKNSHPRNSATALPLSHTSQHSIDLLSAATRAAVLFLSIKLFLILNSCRVLRSIKQIRIPSGNTDGKVVLCEQLSNQQILPSLSNEKPNIYSIVYCILCSNTS